MLKDFKTYQLSVQFYKECSRLRLPRHLRDQVKFYFISFGSLRECQAILQISGQASVELYDLADHLAASLYKLTRA
jgi:hypothetical protein